jgi:Domain of unknown function (DUF4203)
MIAVAAAVTCGVALLVGALLALAGARIFRGALFLLAFTFAFLACSAALARAPVLLNACSDGIGGPLLHLVKQTAPSLVSGADATPESVSMVVVPFLFALLAACCVSCLVPVALFAGGALLGLLAVAVVFSLRDGGLVPADDAWTGVRVGLFVGVPLLLGVVAVCFERLFVAVTTSFAGAFVVLAAVDFLAFASQDADNMSLGTGKSPLGVADGFSEALWLVVSAETQHIDAHGARTYVEAALWLLVGVCCSFIQLRWTARDFHRGRRSRDDRPGLCLPRFSCCSSRRRRHGEEYVLLINDGEEI